MLKRTILILSAGALMSLAMAQSDGRSFDAAVELVPGMTVERNGVIYGGDYTRGLLQSGDVVRTDAESGNYLIVTSDGSVISLSSNAEVSIAGGLRGFDVFQVNMGSANVVGNALDGYPVNAYFRSLLSNRVTTTTDAGVPITSGPYEPVVTGYSNVYYGPDRAAYGPMNPYLNNVVIQPWSPTYWPTTVYPMTSWWTQWNSWNNWGGWNGW